MKRNLFIPALFPLVLVQSARMFFVKRFRRRATAGW